MPKRLYRLLGTGTNTQNYRTRFVIWFAILLHLVWAGCLMNSASPLGVTAIFGLRAFGFNVPAIVFVLITASLFAAMSLIRDKHDITNLVMVLPQQCLLVLSANSALHAMMTGAFADGVPRPTEFMVADQAPAIILATLHACAVVEPYIRTLLEDTV
jgi:hypothetical protein